MIPTDNRAVSALFRVFGGAEPPVVAEAQELADRRGMHRARVPGARQCLFRSPFSSPSATGWSLRSVPSPEFC